MGRVVVTSELCNACIHCLDQPSLGFDNPAMQRMILCPTCGNKRCPRATHHDNRCTRSNAVGQAGSVYSIAETPERQT